MCGGGVQGRVGKSYLQCCSRTLPQIGGNKQPTVDAAMMRHDNPTGRPSNGLSYYEQRLRSG
jgi:hypothetical protein